MLFLILPSIWAAQYLQHIADQIASTRLNIILKVKHMNPISTKSLPPYIFIDLEISQVAIPLTE